VKTGFEEFQRLFIGLNLKTFEVKKKTSKVFDSNKKHLQTV
jgi:hypothetical protein